MEKRMDVKKVALAALLFIIIAVLYWEPFKWLFKAWLTNPYYSHGILIPPIIAFLVWRTLKLKNDNEGYKNGGVHTAGLILVADGAALFLAGHLAQSGFITALSIVPLCSGMVMIFSGVTHLLFPIHFLLAAIPMPWVQNVGVILQGVSVYGSYHLAKLFWHDVTLSYPTITVQGVPFTIDLACSGLNSMISLFTLSLLFAYFISGSWWKKILICTLSVPFAISANLSRILITMGIGMALSSTAAYWFFHYASDLVLFLIALTLLFVSCKVMKCQGFEKIIP